MTPQSTNACAALLLSLVAPSAAALSIEARMAVPGSDGAAEPAVAARNGSGYFLTFLDRAPALRVRRVSVDSRGGLGFEPRGDVAQGPALLANWADFPSLVQLPNGDLVAQYPTRGDGAHASNLELARSPDEGRTWSEPVRLNRDGVAAEHGFAALVQIGREQVAVAWLDGRDAGGEHGAHAGAMSLRAARFARLNRLDEIEVDGRTCDCCQTDAAATRRGHVVVYRDRGGGEVRDVALARHERGRYQPATVVSRDGWVMPGCPVNGPAVAARRDRVVVAWYTEAGGEARVRLAQSLDGGRTFAEAVDVARDAVGRVDVALTDGGRVLVTWLARDGSATELRAATFDRDLASLDQRAIARLAAGRSTGFPRMATQDATALLAWTAPQDDGGTRIEVALLRVD